MLPRGRYIKVPDFLHASGLYKTFHLTMILVWTVMFPVTLLTGLKNSLPFVAFISLYANWATEFGAWQATRAEVKVDVQTILNALVVADLKLVGTDMATMGEEMESHHAEDLSVAHLTDDDEAQTTIGQLPPTKEKP
jgi:hypothetical protein